MGLTTLPLESNHATRAPHMWCCWTLSPHSNPHRKSCCASQVKTHQRSTKSPEHPCKDGLPLIKKADALLYLGPPEKLTLAPPPRGSLEPAYLQEVDRRSMIEWGELRARKFLGLASQ